MQYCMKRFWGYLAVILVLSVIGVYPAGAVETDKITDPLAISTELQETGTARVIVTFSLDGYDGLLQTALTAKKNAAAAVVGSGPKAQAASLQNTAQVAGKALSKAINTGVAKALSGASGGTLTTKHVFSTIPAAVLTVDTAGLHALENLGQVVHIEYDKRIPLPEPVETEGGAGTMATDYGTALIGADQAWSQGYTGNGWYVAVIDTGIRRTHEFFTGKDIVEACFTSRTEDNPNTTLCPNGEDTQYGEGAAAFRGDASESGYDHGVHVAGIAVGHKSDDSLNGVAKGANLIAINVFADGYSYAGQSYTSASWSDVIRALEYVYSLAGSYKIASVNMSIGAEAYTSPCDDYYSSIKTAIDNLKNVNIASAVAAGNEYYCSAIDIPACISSSVAVGASDSSDVKVDFSNWQTDMVPLFAPGLDIISSTGGSDTSYEAWDGTSMATPFVAGAWAVIRQKAPNASVDDVLNALKNTAAHVTFNTCSSPTDIDRRISVIGALNEFSVAAGQADILFRNPDNGRNAVWFLSGSSYVSFSTFASAAENWNIAGTGDFNGDGETDILWRSNSGKTAIWHMNNAELQDYAFLQDVPSAWQPMGVGDCNQDGHVDIYWQNEYTRQIAVWYMNDTTLSEFAYVGETQDAPWTLVGVGDFNADSSPDLLWRNTDSGDNQIWLMSGLSKSSSVDIQNAAAKWDVVGTGDFNDDDQPDILWTNPDTGANCIWYMNGTSYSNFEKTNTVATPWEAQGVGVFH